MSKDVGVRKGHELGGESAATGRYVTAYDCGHRVQESSHAPNSATIAQCHVCGRWVGVIVMWRPDADA